MDRGHPGTETGLGAVRRDYPQGKTESRSLLHPVQKELQKRRSFVSEIIEYFIIDATYESMENLLTIEKEIALRLKGLFALEKN